jgi:hypothetical protein
MVSITKIDLEKYGIDSKQNQSKIQNPKSKIQNPKLIEVLCFSE